MSADREVGGVHIYRSFGEFCDIWRLHDFWVQIALAACLHCIAELYDDEGGEFDEEILESMRLRDLMRQPIRLC